MGSVDAVPGTLFGCEYSIPDAKSPLHDVVSRWSDTYVEKPAMVVVPATEKDVVDVINYAKAHSLKVMPACGAHGNFAPLDANTIYLDMKKFDDMQLDKEAGVIKLGGGVIVRQLIKYITSEGYCTGWPNSNAVGMTGFTLGGGVVRYEQTLLRH
jgi:FAD/FMN-containing dehydrogenase